MKKSIIEFKNVSFTYADENDDQKTLVAEDLNVSVEEGTFLAVLGHNGSGKSTFAKLCNGIILPTKGQVLVDGMDTSDESLKYDIRQTVGMVFQNPDNQIVATVVEEDVAFGPENLGIAPKEIRRRVDEALKAVGMYDFRRSEPHNLSGGQKQRVAIAGIIAMRPRCIVLDESTAMLDPQGRKEVMETIKRLNREMGITVIYITHYMDEAVEADRVIVMNDAKIVMDAPPEEVFKNVEKIKSIGLDVPQPTELLYMLSQRGFDVKTDILSIDECIDEISALLEE